MKLLFVAAGRLPIPPTGWGAVEKLIDEQMRFLNGSGLARVDVLNRRNPALVQLLQARPWQYDWVHLHDDSRTNLWTSAARLLRFRYGRNPFRLAVTTHHGYAAFPDRWGKRYRAQFDALRGADAFFALSPRIAALARKRGFDPAKIVTQPNGLFVDEMRFAPVAEEGGVIILGKVDNRKRQASVADALRGASVTGAIVGPLSAEVPPDFDGNGVNVLYKGVWNRADVRDKLTRYAALALLSDGEAHPLVVLEALAAGLSVVVSEEAGENVDAHLPFVFRVNREDNAAVVAAIAEAVRTNPAHRVAARRYAAQTFDWSVILPRYIATLESLAA